MHVLIPDRLRSPADIEQSVFGPGAVILLPPPRDEYWSQADAILAWHEVHLTAGIIKKLERCKVIVRIGVGFETVDLQAAGERGIYVCNVPDYGTEDVADHALAMMLAFQRGLVGYDLAARRDDWSWDAAGPLRRIRGRTLGIIGLGRIGTAVALRARAFGMNVVFYDPYKPRGYDKTLGITQSDALKDLLAQSGIVTLHTPLTGETRRMADSNFFSQLPAGAVFINTSRGGCYDLDAVSDALRSGHLGAAGLDVFPSEPPSSDHPLIKAWRSQESWLAGRLMVTPHSAFWNLDSYAEMRRKAAEEALRVLNGREPLNCVNRQWIRSKT